MLLTVSAKGRFQLKRVKEYIFFCWLPITLKYKSTTHQLFGILLREFLIICYTYSVLFQSSLGYHILKDAHYNGQGMTSCPKCTRASQTEICFYCLANYFAFLLQPDAMPILWCHNNLIPKVSKRRSREDIFLYRSTPERWVGRFIRLFSFHHDINTMCVLSYRLASINSTSGSVSFPFAPAFPCATFIFSELFCRQMHFKFLVRKP